MVGQMTSGMSAEDQHQTRQCLLKQKELEKPVSLNLHLTFLEILVLSQNSE